jgi:hypothetical protein
MKVMKSHWHRMTLEGPFAFKFNENGVKNNLKV